ncbi:hypothetical protein FRB94_001749 [Tulasnella sp. JGI-2019a]|nr:hypothetical protein FRB94_001749 [Tulasnella sp. JGI-2019a]
MAQQDGRSREDPASHTWANPRLYPRHGEYDPPPPSSADNRLNRHHLPPPPNFSQNYSGYHQDAYQQHSQRPQDPPGRFVAPSPTMHGPVHGLPALGPSPSWDRHRSLAPTPLSLGVYARGDPALEGIPNYTRPRRTRTPSIAPVTNGNSESLSYQPPPPLHYQPPSDSPHSMSRSQMQQHSQHSPSPYPPILSPVRTSQPPSSAAWTPVDAPWERRTPIISASPSDYSDRRRSNAPLQSDWVDDRGRDLPPLSRNWDRDHSRDGVSSSPRVPPPAAEDSASLSYGHGPRYRRESEGYASHPPTPRAGHPPTPNSSFSGGIRAPLPVSPYPVDLPYDEPPMTIHDNGYLNRDRPRSDSYRLSDPGTPLDPPPMEASRRVGGHSHSRTSSITETAPPPGYERHRRLPSGGSRTATKTIVKPEPIDVDEPGELKGSPAPPHSTQRQGSESLEMKHSLVSAAATAIKSPNSRTTSGGSVNGVVHGLPSRPVTAASGFTPSTSNGVNNNSSALGLGLGSTGPASSRQMYHPLPSPQHHSLPPPPAQLHQHLQEQPHHSSASGLPGDRNVTPGNSAYLRQSVSSGSMMTSTIPPPLPPAPVSSSPMLPTPENSPTIRANGSWPSGTDPRRVVRRDESRAFGGPFARQSNFANGVTRDDSMDVDKRNDQPKSFEMQVPQSAEPTSNDMDVDEEVRRGEEEPEEEEEPTVPKTRGRGRKRKAARAPTMNGGNSGSNNANGDDDQGMDVDTPPEGGTRRANQAAVREGVLKYLRDNERLVTDAETSYDFIEDVFAQSRILVEAPCSRKRTTADDVVDEVAGCPEMQAVCDAYMEGDGVQEFLKTVVRQDYTEVTSKAMMLREQYRTLNKDWEAYCIDLDRQIAAEKGLVTPVAPPLTPIVETPVTQSAPSFPSRATRRSTAGNLGLLANAVRSEAEFEQIMATLGNEDLVDPNVLSIRNAANIPDMFSVLPLSTPLLDVKYDDNNGVVDYPEQFYDIHATVGAWTEDEKEVYMEQFGVYGKQFGKIAAHLPHKSPEQCVLFYYLTKRGIVNFRDVVNRANGVRGKRKRGQLAKRSAMAPMMGKQKGNALLMDIRTRMDNDTPMDSPNNSPRMAEMEFGGPSRRRWYNTNTNTNTESATPVPQDGPAKSRAARAAARSKRIASRSSGDDTPARESGDDATQSGAESEAEAAAEPLPEAAPAPPKRKHRRKIVQADEETTAIGEPPVKRRQRASSHWTTAEKATFVEQLTLVGRRWESISSVIKSKSATQCRNYFFSHQEEMGFAELAEQAEARLEAARQERSGQHRAKPNAAERGQRGHSSSSVNAQTQNGYDNSGQSSRSVSHHEQSAIEAPVERPSTHHPGGYGNAQSMNSFPGIPQSWDGYNSNNTMAQPQRQQYNETNGSMTSYSTPGPQRPTSSHSYGGNEAYHNAAPAYEGQSNIPVPADPKKGGSRLYFFSEHMYGNQQQPGGNIPQRSSAASAPPSYLSNHAGMRTTNPNDTNNTSREAYHTASAMNGDTAPHTPPPQDSSAFGRAPPAQLHVLPPFGAKPSPLHAHRRSGSQASLNHQALDQPLPEPKEPLMVTD